MLYGAIIGDIAGSRFEFHNIKGKGISFELLHPKCFFTDDTVMTVAIANAVRQCKPDRSNLEDLAVTYMQSLGRAYPHRGYGRRFYQWLQSEDPHPYNSCGNGSAMRVSAVGYAAWNMADAIRMAGLVTRVTHNHPEGIKGAEATAACVYMAANGFNKDDIAIYVRDHFYPLSFTLDEIRDEYKFNELARFTVPQAIETFLEASSYEETIRLAITLGGDSDTLAAIAGSIAGAYYGVPDYLKREAENFLPADLLLDMEEFDLFIKEERRAQAHDR